MTTYVLHGGATSMSDPKNEAFFSQFTGLADSDSVTIAICYWARSRDRWDALFDRDSSMILEGTTKSVNLLVSETVDDLLNDVERADVLYVSGGSITEVFLEHMEELKQLATLLDQKVYIGSSLGAYLASSLYTRSVDFHTSTRAHYGLGLIPLGVMCHYDTDEHRDEKMKLIHKTDPEMPILILNECEWVRLVL